jgi:renalase
MRIGIIGAGMSGLSCADGLKALGHDVRLFDKGRGPGGRMATRRIETSSGIASFDHGAQYFTAQDPGFCRQVDLWNAQGVIGEWILPRGSVWVGTPSMNNVIKAMAASHDVRWGCQIEEIRGSAQNWVLGSNAEQFAGFDGIVLAVPAEQAMAFLALHDFDMARQSMLAPSTPCWTGMFAFAEKLPAAGDVLRDEGIIGWAARNTAKPGRGGPESWVVQASAGWSQKHLEDSAPDVATVLMDALSSALGIRLPVPIAATAHRWRYALSAGLGVGALWNSALRLGVCGDWLLGPRVECAWLSGQALARRIADTGTAATV